MDFREAKNTVKLQASLLTRSPAAKNYLGKYPLNPERIDDVEIGIRAERRIR